MDCIVQKPESQNTTSDLPETENRSDCSTAREISSEDDYPQLFELDFPDKIVAKFDLKLGGSPLSEPVLLDQEFECLMDASLYLGHNKNAAKSEACKRFFGEDLTIAFTRNLTNEAVSDWKPHIHIGIHANCMKLVELCVFNLFEDDSLPLLDLLAMVFDPNNKFHAFNADKPSCGRIIDEESYSRSPLDAKNPYGWLLDLINRFGNRGGFTILLMRFLSTKFNLTIAMIRALLRPFGLCYQLLTINTVVRYFIPIATRLPTILKELMGEELKAEVKIDSISTDITAIITAMKNIISHAPDKHQEKVLKNLESLELQIILRRLQISSFDGKMDALNAMNKVISGCNSNRNSAERMANWMRDNEVVKIILHDLSLQQPQYVEKLEKILRFVINERALTLDDLGAVWAARVSNGGAIVENIHELLAKIAWDFSPEHLDYLFACFKTSWMTANKRARDKLLELMRRLAEDDVDNEITHKVLTLLWDLAHLEEVPNKVMDHALREHFEILNHSCLLERDAQYTIWLNKYVEELKSGNNWALPALTQIRKMCNSYLSNPNNQCTDQVVYYRQEVINRLQNQHNIIALVINSLKNHMDKVRQLVEENPEMNATNFKPDGRFNHLIHLHERLNFLRFILKDGHLLLDAEEAKKIWQCLVEHSVFESDKDACYGWFAKSVADTVLDPTCLEDFFEQHVLQIDPTWLTSCGFKCFKNFFKTVNTKKNKLARKNEQKHGILLREDLDLIGADYLWRVVTTSPEDIAKHGIKLLKEVNSNAGPRLLLSVHAFQKTFLDECSNQLRLHNDLLSHLIQQNGIEEFADGRAKIAMELEKISRVFGIMQEYANQCAWKEVKN